MSNYRYALPLRLLHWLVALVLLFSLATGLTLGWLGFEGAMETFGSDGTDTLYTAHKTLGVLILGLMLPRLLLRLLFGKPAYEVALPDWQRIASSTVHGLLYVLLLAMPILGWLATAAGDFPVQFFHLNLPGLIAPNQELSETLYTWHGRVAWGIIVLALIHVAAALHHWLVRRDGVMARISLLK